MATIKQSEPKRITVNNHCVNHPDFKDGKSALMFISYANEYNAPHVSIYERDTMNSTQLSLEDLKYLVHLLENYTK